MNLATGPGFEWAHRIRRASWLLPLGLTLAIALSKTKKLPGFPCPLKALTGLPCPTCYLTRATAAALQGNLAEATQLHLFGPVLAALLLVWSTQAILQRRLFPLAVPAPVLIASAFTLFGYWLARITLHYGLGVAAFPAP